MNNSIIATQEDVKQFIILSNGKAAFVPDGADREAFRKVEEAKLRNQGKPRKATRRRRNSRKTNYAAQVAARGKAQAELVSRVNRKMTEAETEAMEAIWEATNPDMEIERPF